MDMFDRAFKETNLGGYNDFVSLEVLCKVFKSVNQWCVGHLKAGDFIYAVRYFVDQTKERFAWEYVIAGPNMPISFSVREVYLGKDAFLNGITVRGCMQGIYQQLLKADNSIAEFNKLVLKFKPKLPLFDQRAMMRDTMGATQEFMERFYFAKYKEAPSARYLKEGVYEARVLSDGIKKVKDRLVAEGCKLSLNVFEMSHIGWSQVRMIYEFRGVDIRFVLTEDDINLYGEVRGHKIPVALEGMFKSADAAIRQWNWLIDGGHNRGSRVKSQFEGYHQPQRRWNVWG